MHAYKRAVTSARLVPSCILIKSRCNPLSRSLTRKCPLTDSIEIGFGFLWNLEFGQCIEGSESIMHIPAL